MSQTTLKFSSLAQLQDKLAEILQSGPLYRRLNYTEEACHYVDNTRSAPLFGLLPRELHMFCSSKQCKKEQRWTCESPKVYLQDEIKDREYACNNCQGKSIYKYYLIWTGEKGKGSFTKVGQYPPLENTVPSVLEKQLGATGIDYYRKALTCRNSSYGIGALSYLRRVIEDRMNDLLDLVIETAKASEYEIDVSGIEEIKASKRFDNKAEFAGKILPPHLKPGGHNPFDILHDLFSEGVHSMTEEDCIDQFDKTKEAFEFLFKNMTLSKEEATAYLQTLSNLAKKRKK